MHFGRIPKSYLFFWKLTFQKNALFLSVDDLYTKMLIFQTHGSVAQWYVTGLQI